MMKMKKMVNLGLALSVAGLMGLSGQAVQAAVSIAPALSIASTDAVAPALGQASPSFTFTFDTEFDLAGFELTVAFDPSMVTFNAAASTLSVGPVTETLPTVLFGLSQTSGGDFLFSPGPGGFGTAVGAPGAFTITGLYQSQSTVVPAGSSFVMTSVFNLLPAFAAGSSTQVRAFGYAFDPSFQQENFDLTATVTAVPEPETWLMLLGGLGLLAQRVRRRKQ